MNLKSFPLIYWSNSAVESQEDLHIAWYYWLVIFVISGYWIFHAVKKYCEFRRLQKLLEKFPGPKPLPVLGNALLLNKENHEYFSFTEELVKNYGKLHKMWLFYKPYILIADPNIVEKILMSKENLDKGDDMDVFRRWWGSGLLTASAEKWKPQRKLLNSTFSHSVLMGFMDIFNQESISLIHSLDQISNTQKPFNLVPYLTTCTLNIICETAMGKKLHNSGSVNQEYIDAVTGMYHILLARMTRPWLRPNIIWKFSPYGYREQKYLKILHGFTDKVIKEKKAARQKTTPEEQVFVEKDVKTIEGQKVKMAFMDYLLDLADNGKTLSDTDIRNEVDTFMAAGHDTTATMVLWTLFLLATYPEHQAKVHQEIDDLFEENKDQAVTVTELSKMNHLGLCIKETIRIYPIVPFNFRKISEDVKCDEEKSIPAGVNVVIMPYLIHRDPKYFPNPEEFLPERFTVEGCKGRHPFAYIPFSAGPRNCIGQKFGVYEAKVILSYLLRNYNWKVLEERESVKLDLDLVIRPLKPLQFIITKRIKLK